MADDGVLRVEVVARQRLALGTGSEVSFFTDSHAFVPGSVLRGALAASWIAEHGPPDRGNADAAWFRELFDGRIRYGPLHAVGSGVVPVSAWLCKYPKDDACGRQAVDAAFESGTQCPACGGPLEQGKGQVQLPAGMSLERITRTSIDPATAKAKEGELYAHAALPARITLCGFIHGRDPWLEHSRPLRLGGRRTVGGAADYHAESAERQAPAEQLTADGNLTIRLNGPAVFVDAAGRPRTDPDPVLDLEGAEISRTWARPVTWTGWHAAARLPKPEELCAAGGSTYQLSGPPEILRQLAARLRREGAGLRRAEGFGDIEVVTSPWRPVAAAAVAALEPGSDAASLDWHRRMQELGLDASLRRWVVGALRELQLDRARPVGDSAAPGRLAGELLARPAADGFSGRQRDLLRSLFTETDLGVLRDVTTLLLADLPAAEGTE